MVQADLLTELLAAHRAGEPGALDRVMDLAYGELHRLARLQRRRPSDTLDTTGLVHEVWLKFSASDRLSASDRQHFYNLAARAMRQLVLDRARYQARSRRGAGLRAKTLDANYQGAAHEVDLTLALAVDEALERLSVIDERLVRVVECRFFAGYTEEETATTLGVSVTTAQRLWRRSRRLLRDELA